MLRVFARRVYETLFATSLLSVLGTGVVNSGKTLQLKELGYEEMAGTYKCTVTGIGGQNSKSSILDVHCNYGAKLPTEW